MELGTAYRHLQGFDYEREISGVSDTTGSGTKIVKAEAYLITIRWEKLHSHEHRRRKHNYRYPP